MVTDSTKSRWPNFFIVGAPKAGTTSLYEYLRQHPDVYMSTVKEPHFFSHPTGRYVVKEFNQTEYLDLFRDAGGAQAIGEASPSYLRDPEAAGRIAEVAPEARIIILLREPIERAYSHYLMDVRLGIEDLPFFEALQEDAQRPTGTGAYIEIGLYHTHVKRYIEQFGHHRVLVLLTSELNRDPRGTLIRVAEFLGIPSDSVSNIQSEQAHNSFAMPRNTLVQQIMGNASFRDFSRRLIPRNFGKWVRDSFLLKRGAKPPLDMRAHAFLMERYAPQIAGLEDLLGRQLPELRKGWQR